MFASLTTWFLGTKLGRIAGMAAVVLVALLGAFLYGRAKGGAAEREKRLRERLEAVEKRKETDNEVDSLEPDALDDGLDPWMRD